MARTYTLRKSAAPSGLRIDYAASLNEQQCAAVVAPPGPALVIAGAGSGKTRTLTYRVAYLLENGVLPSQILLLTFTNKAAREMLDRVTALAPEASAGIWGGTFHSVGNRLLRRNAAELGFRAGFSIMDREDQEDLIKAVFTSAGLNPKDKRYPKAEVLGDVFSFAVNTGRSIEEVLKLKFDYFLDLAPEIQRLQKLYEERKKSANCMDFDDLLSKTVLLLRAGGPAAEWCQRQFQFVLVDEYQDTNSLQAEFIDLVAKHHRNVMVVGDDAQAIYSWRGAVVANILEFPKRYPDAKVYRIETNYRSTPEILTLANAAIEANTKQFDKTLRPARDTRDFKPALIELNDGTQQAVFVVQRMLELRDEGTELNEMAVLYRAHFHSMELQLELTRHGVPFTITSGLRFFEQAHVKDVASFLKFAVNPRDEVAFKRIARLLPGIGGVAADKLWRHFESAIGAAERPPSGFVEALKDAKVPGKALKSWAQLLVTLDEISPGGSAAPPAKAIETVMTAVYDDYAKTKFPNYEARREDLNTLQNYSRQYDDPAEFLGQLALVSALETESALAPGSEDNERVTLSSVHQAKGLEWKVVFVINLTDGGFPSHRSIDVKESLEEERRLFYVAVTRAGEELYLTWPQLRLNAGYGDLYQRPSRFIDELPADTYEKWEIERGW